MTSKNKNVQVPQDETIRMPIVVPSVKLTQAQRVQYLEDEVGRLRREYHIVDNDLTKLYVILCVAWVAYVISIVIGGDNGN
jgi:hypothetical protein